jgi:hypothetical protein
MHRVELNQYVSHSGASISTMNGLRSVGLTSKPSKLLSAVMGDSEESSVFTSFLEEYGTVGMTLQYTESEPGFDPAVVESAEEFSIILPAFDEDDDTYVTVISDLDNGWAEPDPILIPADLPFREFRVRVSGRGLEDFVDLNEQQDVWALDGEDDDVVEHYLFQAWPAPRHNRGCSSGPPKSADGSASAMTWWTWGSTWTPNCAEARGGVAGVCLIAHVHKVSSRLP